MNQRGVALTASSQVRELADLLLGKFWVASELLAKLSELAEGGAAA